MRQKQRKTTEKETHCPRVKLTQQILTERLSGKAKQKTNWSVSTFKGKRKVFRLELVKFKTRAFNRKIVIKLIPILLNSLTSNNHF